jgi:hypothetical protein
MPGRRSLRGGKPRLLGHHGGWQGFAYHRHFTALEATYVLDTPLRRMEGGRCSARWVRWQADLRALRDAEQAREEGRGRRPSAGLIRQLAKREALSDQGYSRAVERLAELAPARSKLGAPWR